MAKSTSGLLKLCLFDLYNDVEKNCILYYADYLSLERTSRPVTDSCKYFFIHGFPVNSTYIAGHKPTFNPKNAFILKAIKEYELIRDRFDDEGVESYIGDICMLRARGCVGALEMLLLIHLHSTKGERIFAIKEYNRWKRDLKYEHVIFDEDGKIRWVPCKKYVAHAERKLFKRGLLKNTGYHGRTSKENSK